MLKAMCVVRTETEMELRHSGSESKAFPANLDIKITCPRAVLRQMPVRESGDVARRNGTC